MNDRRNFLKLTAISGFTSILTLKGVQAANECDFRPTAKQPLGPFYPRSFPIDTDADLTLIPGTHNFARGQVVVVSGVITDEHCQPIKGAIVEIWQACDTGKYNHPSDTSDNALDPNFQYYGTMRTNEKGEYSFRTIKPGSYLASETWRRPPHIHYKVSLRGYREVVSQLYFDGEELNQKDLILLDLHPEDQKKVVVKFLPVTEKGRTILRGKFDLTLKKL